jgi:hypothetical protein
VYFDGGDFAGSARIAAAGGSSLVQSPDCETEKLTLRELIGGLQAVLFRSEVENGFTR